MKPCLNNTGITYAMKTVASTSAFACFNQPEVHEPSFFLNTPEEAESVYLTKYCSR